MLKKEYVFSTDIGDLIHFTAHFVLDKDYPTGMLSVYQGEQLLAWKYDKFESFEDAPLQFKYQDTM